MGHVNDTYDDGDDALRAEVDAVDIWEQGGNGQNGGGTGGK